MEFRLLGPVEVWSADGRIDIGPAKQRCVLAALAVTPGHPLPIEVLVERVWGDSSPKEVRRALYSYLTRLRRALGPEVTVLRKPGGYALTATPEQVDLVRFRQSLTEAHTLVRTDARGAARLLRSTLGLWRGSPLADLPGEWVARTRDNLRQQRLAALTELGELELRLGRHAELIDDLRDWLDENPLSEPLIGQLLRALSTVGRRAEALDLYARTRDHLGEELGTEPGPELQRLHQRILRRDPTLEVPISAVAGLRAGGSAASSQPELPRQLPRLPATFVGRGPELADAQKALFSATATVAVYGPGGIGKSTLALVAAHGVRSQFPDGQLYVDLQGASPGLSPLEPLDVLSRFLRALRVDGSAIPSDVDEAAALFRTITAELKLLVLLDNAAGVSQVRPLLPTGTRSAALITSRSPLTTLDDAVHIGLTTLPPEESAVVLSRLDISGRCAAAPEETARLAELCGHLPLALRITAARMLARPDWPIRTFVERLTDRQRRLDELGHHDLTVRACLDVTYRALHDSEIQLDQEAARAFGLLALPDGPDLSVPVAARLLDRDEPTTETILDRLLDAQLLESRTPGRHRMHDLTRDYAREVAARAGSEAYNNAALDRAWRIWLGTSARAAQLIRTTPRNSGLNTMGALPLSDRATAIAWTADEYANLLALARQAASSPDDGRAAVAMEVAHALESFQSHKSQWTDGELLCEQALQVARRLDDPQAKADFAEAIALAIARQGRLDEAVEEYHQALASYRAIGDRHGEGVTLTNLSEVLWRRGEFATATASLLDGLALSRETGDRYAEAIALAHLGTTHARLGRSADAINALQEALELAQANGDQVGQAVILTNFAEAYLIADDPARAAPLAAESLALHRTLGNRRGEAIALSMLGNTHLGSGRYAEAVGQLRAALTIAERIEMRQRTVSLHAELAHALRLSGQLSLALRHCETGLNLCQGATFPFEAAYVSWRLGETLRDVGQTERAREFLREAYEQFRELGVGEAQQVYTLLENNGDT
ncbi:AfsR/SARP family transcriptional regulator [Actinopolymorpha alba]|uniref:AfsR/SARP family transcriptional regulator n=1 Tax=Actinopolymorpha alba TaxID=533267 RepID=UPI000371AF43|nr:BTAD domain-containing putative transcriptional regulator [Actinopolymorpha alba]